MCIYSAEGGQRRPADGCFCRWCKSSRGETRLRGQQQQQQQQQWRRGGERCALVDARKATESSARPEGARQQPRTGVLTAEGKRGCVGKRGRAGCSWGGVVRLKDRSKHSKGQGRGWEHKRTAQDNRHRHPETPWHGLGRCAALALALCFGSALTDCQKHEVRADPFEIGCEPTDTAYHSAPMQVSRERRQRALNRGRPACISSFDMEAKARAVQGRRYLRFCQLHVPCKRNYLIKQIHMHTYCLAVFTSAAAVRLALAAHQRAVMPSRRRLSPACLCQFPTLPQIGAVAFAWSRH